MSRPRPIAFLSDYGYRDPFAGICHSVIASIDPTIPVIHVTHGLEPHDVRGGAVALADTVPFLPAGAIALVIVDPGVGGSRRAVALDTADGISLVGPDNGTLWLAAQRLGGVTAIVDASESPAHLEPTSATFHGRDLFAPIAARLALGDKLEKLGKPLAPGDLTSLGLPVASLSETRIDASVLDIDTFGNVRLCASIELLDELGVQLGDALEVETSSTNSPASRARTFGDVPPGELLVYEDASGALAIAANRERAADALRLTRDSRVGIIRA